METNCLHNEKELLLRLAEGDEKAFESLFMHFKDRVYEIAMAYTESTVFSEEIVQDIFVKVWMKRPLLPGIENFNAWLFTLTRNCSFNVLRDQARSAKNKKEMISHLPDPVCKEEGRLMAKDTERLIYKAMELLSPSQRKAFELLKLKELSREEGAREMGVSANTIKVHLLNATRIVRAYLVSREAFLFLPLFAMIYFFLKLVGFC